MAWTYEQLFNGLTDGDLNGQDSWSGNTGFDVTTETSYEGAKDVSLTTTSDTFSTITRTVTGVSAGVCYVSMKRGTSSAQANANFELYDGGGGDLLRIFQNGSNYQYLDSTGWNNLIATDDSWHRIGIEWDNAGHANQFRIQIDNEPWTAWKDTFGSRSFSEITTIRLGVRSADNSTSTTSKFDSISPARLTYYPDPNTETTTVDGHAIRHSVDETWATIRAGNGTATDDSSTTGSMRVTASTTSNQWARLDRFFMFFDTSSIPDANSITSATLSLIGVAGAISNGLSGESSANSAVHIVGTTSTNTTALANADYQTVGATSFGSSDTQVNFSTAVYEDITLNASGLSNISKTGLSRFTAIKGWDYSNTTTGLTWSSGALQDFGVASADTANTSSDPKLVVVSSSSTAYTLDVTVGAFTLTGIATGLLRGLMMAVTVDSFILTGINTAFSYGRGIIAGTGSFTLTGVDVAITSIRTMATTVGEFTLTGIATSLSKGYIMTAVLGTFTLTGNAISFLRNGFSIIWTHVTKNSSTWTNESKNSSSWTNESKNSSTWTNETRN